MEVVGEASYGVEAVDQARKLDPDMILLDIFVCVELSEKIIVFEKPGRSVYY